MKIDSRIMTYDISKQLSKTSLEQAGKLDPKQQSDEKKTGEQNPIEQDTIVHLSSALKEVQSAKEVIASEPDVRADRVAELKERVETGRYRIDHDAVADKLVDSFIDEIS